MHYMDHIIGAAINRTKIYEKYESLTTFPDHKN